MVFILNGAFHLAAGAAHVDALCRAFPGVCNISFFYQLVSLTAINTNLVDLAYGIYFAQGYGDLHYLFYAFAGPYTVAQVGGWGGET